MENYYKTLKVPETATKEEIKKSYRKLAVKYHPDKNKNTEKYNQLFSQINKAYAVLYDDDTRKQYDLRYRLLSQRTEEVTPQLFLEKFQNIRKFIFSKGKGNFSQVALYKALNNLLTDKNLRYLRVNNVEQTNEKIIEEVLMCCLLLSTEEMEETTDKLFFLAGDNSILKRKIKEYKEEHKELKPIISLKEILFTLSSKAIKLFRN